MNVTLGAAGTSSSGSGASLGFRVPNLKHEATSFRANQGQKPSFAKVCVDENISEETDRSDRASARKDEGASYNKVAVDPREPSGDVLSGCTEEEREQT